MRNSGFLRGTLKLLCWSWIKSSPILRTKKILSKTSEVWVSLCDRQNKWGDAAEFVCLGQRPEVPRWLSLVIIPLDVTVSYVPQTFWQFRLFIICLTKNFTNKMEELQYSIYPCSLLAWILYSLVRKVSLEVPCDNETSVSYDTSRKFPMKSARQDQDWSPPSSFWYLNKLTT